MISSVRPAVWAVCLGLLFLLLTALFAVIVVVGDPLPLWMIGAGILTSGLIALLPAALMRPTSPESPSRHTHQSG